MGLEERARTKGCLECDSIWKAHETLHHMVATDKTDKHSVDAALSRREDLRGQFESVWKGHMTATLKYACRIYAFERENQGLRDINSPESETWSERSARNAWFQGEQSAPPADWHQWRWWPRRGRYNHPQMDTEPRYLVCKSHVLCLILWWSDLFVCQQQKFCRGTWPLKRARVHCFTR